MSLESLQEDIMKKSNRIIITICTTVAALGLVACGAEEQPKETAMEPAIVIRFQQMMKVCQDCISQDCIWKQTAHMDLRLMHVRRKLQISLSDFWMMMDRLYPRNSVR